MDTMSKEAKKSTLKDIILKLHEGLSPQDAQQRFEKEVGKVSSSEIAEMEQSLIDDGLSPDEIKKFCNVHALIFQAALEKVTLEETSPSHPVYLFKLENREIEKQVDALKKMAERPPGTSLPSLRDGLKESLLKLRGIETHYQRKEQLLFPFLEKQGFMGPSKVMWGKDNEIRGMMKTAISRLDEIDSTGKLEQYKKETLSPLLEEINGMIFKEENILFPTSLEKLAPADWVEILRESVDIGYVYIEQPAETEELVKHLEVSLVGDACVRDDTIELTSGSIRLGELMPLLDPLPVDITFVDKDDTVRYFSQGKDRIFSRTKSVIGRRVQNCHPPQSLEVVEKILTSFKEGTEDSYDFWINLQGRMIYIRYFAVRDSQRRYLGTLEVTQDITGIQKLTGEKRLLDERS
ncbi:MAG: hypothetical protein A2Z29_10640 [Chloroflexi bacterium RBG_16_56_11]|nr:MAG: hypothetical protein A2Z29_10640 [Chloroflexi bacterium RBG_16_56_11]